MWLCTTWSIHSSLIRVDYGQARANNSYFSLLGKPILYLPYVSHPVDTTSRQSGLLIPTASNSSTKGLIFGEQIYWVLGRSAEGALAIVRTPAPGPAARGARARMPRVRLAAGLARGRRV